MTTRLGPRRTVSPARQKFLQSAIRLLIVFTTLGIDSAIGSAHEGPEHAIETISREIRRHGPTAERHFRRGVEYRASGKWNLFATDLQAAVKLDPEFFPARLELARFELRQQQHAQARHWLEPLFDAGDTSLRAVALATLGEIHLAESDWENAARALANALAIRPEVSWYLQRSVAQANAGNWDELLQGLRSGYAATGSPVLQHALCDRLMAVEKLPRSSHSNPNLAWHTCHAEAMQIVEQELIDCRFPGRWLARRAKLYWAKGDFGAAIVDLDLAIAEFQGRIKVPHPDPELLAELNTAQQLKQQISESHLTK